MRTTLPFLLLLSCFLSPGSYAQTLSVHSYFKTDSSRLSASESSRLQVLIKSLDTVLITKISVYAYCDDVGNEAYNQNLSIKRAETVKTILSTLLPGNTVQAEGKGEVPLSGMIKTDEERTANRRVDITVFYSLKQQPAVVEKPIVEKSVVTEPEKKKVVAESAPILSDDQKAGDKITLENILFVGGRHTLLPESYEALEMLTTVLLEKKKYHIMILGHICCVTDGNDGIDFDTGISNLSVARARAIYNYLVQHGVSPERLSYKGLKAKYPTGKGDREDRRVEIEITKVISN